MLEEHGGVAYFDHYQTEREGGRGLKHFPPNPPFPDLTPESYFCTGLVWAVRNIYRGYT